MEFLYIKGINSTKKGWRVVVRINNDEAIYSIIEDLDINIVLEKLNRLKMVVKGERECKW